MPKRCKETTRDKWTGKKVRCTLKKHDKIAPIHRHLYRDSRMPSQWVFWDTRNKEWKAKKKAKSKFDTPVLPKKIRQYAEDSGRAG